MVECQVLASRLSGIETGKVILAQSQNFFFYSNFLEYVRRKILRQNQCLREEISYDQPVIVYLGQQKGSATTITTRQLLFQ